jgi:diguanylate cyclase (GGDEF)-like protein
VDFRAERDEVAAAALPLLSVALGLMLLLSAFFRLHRADSVPGTIGMAAVAVTGLGLLVTAVVLWRTGVVGENAHQTGTVILVVAALGLSVSMVANGSLAQTVYAELLLVCAGAVLLRPGWLITALAALWMLWLGVAALLAGTTDPSGYLLAMMGASVIAIIIHTLRTDSLRALGGALRAAEAEAVRDDLTGLLNRRGMAEVGRELMAVARRSREPMSCTFIDVDGLKDVNDAFGHDAGDELIASVAESLTGVFREADVVVRWGGDEFVVLALGAGPRVEEVERRLIERLQQTDVARSGRWQPAVSAGRVVHMPWQDETLEGLLERADQEMYRRRRIKRAAIADEAP